MEEESLCHIKQWKKEAYKLIGHPITERAAPTGKQAIILFSCFDCNYVNKMVTLDAYVLHLKNRHKVNICDRKLSVAKRNQYLPRV